MVLLFQLHPDVDPALHVGYFGQVDAFALLDRLEVAQLVDPLDAVLQRVGVEDVAFDQVHVPADDAVVRGRVADERDAIDEVLLAFLQSHPDVDDGRKRLGQRGERLRCRFRSGRGIVADVGVGEAGELPVPDAAVHLARLLQAFPDELFVVVLAGLEAEHRLEEFGLDDGVAGEFDVANLVAPSFGDRHAQLDEAGLLVFRIGQELLLRDAHVASDVPALAVIRHDLVGVFVELRFLEGAAAGDERQEPQLLVVLHFSLQRPRAHDLVAGEDDLPDLHLRPFRHVERQVDDLRAARHRLHLRRHLGVLKTLLLEHVAHEARDLPYEARIDERVEPDYGHRLFQPLVDLRRLDFLRADVVDDLDALTLFHVVRDQLALDAVREHVRLPLDPQVVEKAGGPEIEKILVDLFLGRVVIGGPLALRRPGRLEVDVVEVRLVVDERRTALCVETGSEQIDDGPGAGRRQRRGRVDVHFAKASADRRLDGRLDDRLRGRLRGRRIGRLLCLDRRDLNRRPQRDRARKNR